MSDLETSYDVQEVATALGVAAKTVRRAALKHRIGTNWGGRAGYRFTAAEVERLRQARRAGGTTAKDPRPRRGARAVS